MICRLVAALTFHALLVSGALVAEDKPLTPADAAASLQLPEGFHATLFAGEPDVVQPIAFTFDSRGRMWVVECLSYPDWSSHGKGRDRIVIFEDQDGDGRFDKRIVFWDKGSNLTGIELGFGGVWLCSTPNFIFLPDRDGNDVPDGPPEVLLDGWDLNSRHNVFNGLTWGPDGWLYGCNGILSESRIGKPGSSDAQRVPLDCGVWRFSPIDKTFEVVAWGTTNPWGLDFDDHGQMFITNCVIKHLFHVVPGAHFPRMFGQDLNPHAYGLIPSCADHIHWAGGYWDTSIGGKHNEVGGGHAHAGAMVYLGDNWPDDYRNRVFTHNLHGRRVNCDILRRHGSGYLASHARDFLLAQDPWFRGLELKYGPDGAVFATDWSDTGECHDSENTQRGTGRIFKISYGSPAKVQLDISQLSDDQLVELQLHKNDWLVRQARLELHQRAAAENLSDGVRERLWQTIVQHPDVTRKLRALWALHVTGELNSKQVRELLNSPHEFVRAWVIQLELEDGQASPLVLAKLRNLAESDSSPLVRLYLAAALQRLAAEDRWAIAHRLVSHQNDAEDPNIPLMIWYGIEPLVPDAGNRDLALLKRSRLPVVREHLARRITADGQRGTDRLVGQLRETHDASIQEDILRGMLGELRGLRDVPMPKAWREISDSLMHSPRAKIRHDTQMLSLIFGDAQAVNELIARVSQASRSTAERRHALEALLSVRVPGLAPQLHALLEDRNLRDIALRGLAHYDDPQTSAAIVACYASLGDTEKQDALATLASRTHYAVALLDALEAGSIPVRDVSGFTATQIKQLNSHKITDRFTRLWGSVQATPEKKRALIAKYKASMTPVWLGEADRAGGRGVFSRKCAACHMLFGEGTHIGPDLTGSQRENVDYILENIITPSAVVPGDFLVRTFVMDDGRVIAGIVAAQGRRTITVQTANEKMILARAEVEKETRSDISMMPEGLLNDLTPEEVRDLVAYLGSPAQVPLPRN